MKSETIFEPLRLEAMTDPKGVIVCGHGSRDSAVLRELESVVARLGGRLPVD